jgi:hypothetical protein
MSTQWNEAKKGPCWSLKQGHCKEREPGCHSKCELYLKYRKQIDDISRNKAALQRNYQ